MAKTKNINTTIDIVQGSPEWHKMRSTMIGASDAPIIMKTSPYKTPYKLWHEKVGLHESEAPSRAMQHGIDNEEYSRQWFSKQTGIEIAPKVLVHPTLKWMMASLDGADEALENIVEIKQANQEDHSQAVNGEVPEKYFYQLQHQLEVTGLDMVYYVSIHKGEGAILEVGRNTKQIKQMIDEEKAFLKCMNDFYAPELLDKDYIPIDNEEFADWAEEWRDLQLKMHRCEKRSLELKARMLQMYPDKNVMGGGIKITKIARKGNIDYLAIPGVNEMDLEKFRKEPVIYWSIRKA